MRTNYPYWPSRSIASDLFDEMNKFFDEVDHVYPSKIYDERNFAPACEVSELDENYLMSMDIPGMKKEDIKVEINDNVLTVSGERKRDLSSKKNEKVQRFEKTYGYFKRSFALPSAVEVDKVQANYENGVLELLLPKSESVKAKHIEIQTGKSGLIEKLLGTKKSSEMKNVN